MVAPNLQTLMQHSMSLVQIGLAVAGILVVALHLNLARWMPLLLSGFVIQALVIVSSTAITFARISGVIDGGSYSAFSVVSLFIRAGGLLGWLLIVGGLWGVFSDLQRRLAT